MDDTFTEKSLHRNAKTNIKTRKYIQGSDKSVNDLSEELQVSQITIRKWRDRNYTQDKSHVAKKLNNTLNPQEELMVTMLRKVFQLSIDDLLMVTKSFINKSVSRAGLGRLIKKKNLKRKKSLACNKILSLKNNTNIQDIFFGKGVIVFMCYALHGIKKIHSYLVILLETETKFLKIFNVSSIESTEFVLSIRRVLHDMACKSLLLSGEFHNKISFLEKFNSVNIWDQINTHLIIDTYAIIDPILDRVHQTRCEQYIRLVCDNRHHRFWSVIERKEKKYNRKLKLSSLRGVTPEKALQERIKDKSNTHPE